MRLLWFGVFLFFASIGEAKQGELSIKEGLQLAYPVTTSDLLPSPAQLEERQLMKRKVRQRAFPDADLEESLQVRNDILTSKQKKKLQKEQRESEDAP
ncbi:MAG: hypothetical protein NZ480_07795 [Bdellovibrionaceae bacterium]|nr:hypothetical protein [Pseudobdellovibrionaceae bacterium]MDW8189510.1 hypothetical protein [Pseudobdellovibrionaceae bacterium]